MTISRAKFKYLLRQCRRNRASVRADILARDLCKKDTISRAKFKYLLRQCRRNRASVRADILARDLCKKDTKLFCKHVSKQNNSCTSLADTIVK